MCPTVVHVGMPLPSVGIGGYMPLDCVAYLSINWESVDIVDRQVHYIAHSWVAFGCPGPGHTCYYVGHVLHVLHVQQFVALGKPAGRHYR